MLISLAPNTTAHDFWPSKQITIRVHISGTVWPLVLSPNPAIHCHHKQRIFGTVIAVFDCKYYRIHFDIGAIMECEPETTHESRKEAALRLIAALAGEAQ
jgi:hypothetical protein